MKEAILLTDGYKLDHRRQYPEGTEYVYSNWTPRSCHYYPEAKEGAVCIWDTILYQRVSDEAVSKKTSSISPRM